MAGEAPARSTEYITHHLTHLKVGEGFWTLHVDSIFMSVLMGVLALGLFWAAARKATSGVPGRGQAFVEMVVEFVHEHLLASSSIPYVYAPIRVNDNNHWDGAVMYNSPLRPAIDAAAEEILMVLLSPYHKLEENLRVAQVQRSALPPMPRDLLGGVGYVLDLALIGTFENDVEELRKVNRRVRKGASTVPDHREVKCAVIARDEWITPLDIIRYGPKRSNELRAVGRKAARQTFQRIDRLGWDSLYHLDEES